MTVTLNHTIVPARDNAAAADFLAGILDLRRLPPDGFDGKFAPVEVNDSLTLQFMTAPELEPHHLAFDVAPEEFDQVLTRLRDRDVPFGNSPFEPENGRIDHPLSPRGLFFRDDSGNLYEVMSPE
ncbi:VOC family protein [Saccharopolyspora sp. WRP15-2]|uniref:VOC family protein n=1 Tax=Saccharopolyspora oryzae TaxID=2997343 RepID=A0ABT4V5I1_9PSEU|nr:VOC family protein [Saccharopolyspora oryzae]MDA3628696.1 VOC family protein [Saccharopolyspora oryzae]